MRNNGDGINALQQLLNRPRRGFAPSHTAQIMLGRGTYGARANPDNGIEPPILAGNKPDARVNWASRLGPRGPG